MEQGTIVVIAGELSSLLPKGWEDERDITTIHCDLTAKDISRTVESLADCYYTLLLPATSTGIEMCAVVRHLHCKVPIVLVGESKDSEILLYSAQLGCMDFISYADDIRTVKKKLNVYVKLYSVSQRLEKAGENIQGA